MITYNFFKYLYLNWKYTKILNKVYEDEHILENLSKMFETEFKKDWVGRVYTVLNPNINDSHFESNTQIYEYNENGLDNTQFVTKWVMTNLNIAQRYIRAQNLFELLSYDIKKLDNYDNYLLIFQPITLSSLFSYTKKFTLLWGIIGILVISGYFLYPFLNF